MITTAEVEVIDMDKRTRFRLNKILARDTRVIKRYLGILQHLEHQVDDVISSKKNKFGKVNHHISKSALDLYTLTTRDRSTVEFDLKSEFPRISNNELQECRDTAVATYLSYLELRQKRNAVPPTGNGGFIPRIIHRRRAKFDPISSQLFLRDSLDSNLEMIKKQKHTTRHDSLELNLHLHDYAIELLKRSEYKGCRIVRKDRRYFVQIALDYYPDVYVLDVNLPLAVLGIDLGISKTAATSLLTSRAKGVVQNKFFHNQKLVDRYSRYERQISNLQQQVKLRDERRITRLLELRGQDQQCNMQQIHELNRSINQFSRTYEQDLSTSILKMLSTLIQDTGSRVPKTKKKKVDAFLAFLKDIEKVIQNRKIGKYSQVRKKLKKKRNKRSNLKQTYIRQLCAELADYIRELSKNYDLRIIVGDPSGIRRSNYNGNKWLRKKIHRWSFEQFQNSLQHNMQKIGLADRMFMVSEAWTSITCHRCQTIPRTKEEKQKTRPRQNHYICQNPDCGWHDNADFNGANNIAIRGIRYLKLEKNFPNIARWVYKKPSTKT